MADMTNAKEETLIAKSRKRSREETSLKNEDILSDRQIGYIVLSLLGQHEDDFHSSVKKRMEITSEQIARVDRVISLFEQHKSDEIITQLVIGNVRWALSMIVKQINER